MRYKVQYEYYNFEGRPWDTQHDIEAVDEYNALLSFLGSYSNIEPDHAACDVFEGFRSGDVTTVDQAVKAFLTGNDDVDLSDYTFRVCAVLPEDTDQCLTCDGVGRVLRYPHNNDN